MRKTTSDLFFNRRKHRLAQMTAIVFAIIVGVALWCSWANEEGAQDKGITAEKDLDPDFLQWLILENKASEDELTPDEAKKRSRLGSRVFDRLLSTFMARFFLEGTVVDQDGNRLDGVQLRINKAKTRGPDRWVEEKTEQTINGAFALDFDGYTAIYLYFNKDGYYQEMLSFGYDGETTAEDIVLRDRPARRNLVEKRDIRVVMEKKGDITMLMAQEFRLSCRFKDGTPSGYVVDFDRKKWQRRFEGRGHLTPLLVEDMFNKELLPQLCAYIVTDADSKGRILFEEITAGKYGQHKYRLPKKIRLFVNDLEGGVMVYVPDENERSFWAMKKAPENGYQHEVVFDAATLNSRINQRELQYSGIYFYFKVNGLYGKGRISRVEIAENGYELRVDTMFQLQMDGSRNLDTGRQY